jgi:hypothetical protein
MILNLVGPSLAAVIGTFLLGLAASWVTRSWQTRKEDADLRESFIHELLEVARALYLALRQYESLPARPEPWRDLAAEREKLDAVYVRTRTAGDAIEYRLLAYFTSEDLPRNWHAVMDLLTTRYLQLVGASPDNYLPVMEGPQHTTLTSADLSEPDRIFERYKELVRQLPVMLLSAPRRRS